MDKIKVEREAIVLGDKEKEKLLSCLLYCKCNHVELEAVVKEVNVKFLDYMINNL